jgi:ferric iron reductase protein FhuF
MKNPFEVLFDAIIKQLLQLFSKFYPQLPRLPLLLMLPTQKRHLKQLGKTLSTQLKHQLKMLGMVVCTTWNGPRL